MPEFISKRDKIRGMILGVAVGDALGMVVETWDRAKIKAKYPDGIKKYEIPNGHKWFNGQPSGTVTDDTQLTLATMKGMINSKGLDLQAIADEHVNAMKTKTKGWGKSTVEAIKRIANGVSYKDSGKTDVALRGTGNGVPMKLAPLAAFFSRDCMANLDEQFVQFSAMTHYSQMSAVATLIHVHLLERCISIQPSIYSLDFDFFGVIKYVLSQTHKVLEKFPDLTSNNDDIGKTLLKVEASKYDTWNDDKIELEFGGGSCYVYHSLPFTYAYYVRSPHDVKTLYHLVEAGGDTDSNASMLGGLLGALNGIQIFQKEDHLISGLECYEELMKLTDEFCDAIEI